MITLKIHHIGYLVKKIEAAAIEFERLGYKAITSCQYDSCRKVNICFMEKDNYMIELVSPVSAESVAAGLLKKYKNSPYHICYECTDFDRCLKELSEEGYTAIDTPAPAPAIDGRRVVFLMHARLGMIELLEPPA